MVKVNTVLGKAAVLSMLPALTLGIFAVPSAVSADEGVTTEVGVMNVNAGMSKTVVVSGANSGGNTIMAGSVSAGGDSGDSTGVSATARADAANSADVDDVEAAGEEGGKSYDRRGHDENQGGSAEADALATGNAKADAVASSKTGNGGSAGKATTISTIMTGDAKSDVAVVGGTDKNEVDIDVTDDCECDRANTYHMDSVKFLDLTMASEYDKYYREVEEESETEGGKYDRRGGSDEEWSYDEETKSESGASSLDLSTGSAWSVDKKEYVPVRTVIAVGNANLSYEEVIVASGANSGLNTIVAGSASLGGDSGNSSEVRADATADAHNRADVDDVDSEGGDADAAAGAHGNAKGAAGAGSETGDAGAGADSTTDSLILSGRSDSIVTVVETSRHNVVRIQR